ncbi:MAG: DEAD/DEAH box helicase, partial [Planctomycetes bacterium]|nr:DEAD/DEAH box helicase [Planctomycetota bacterium]
VENGEVKAQFSRLARPSRPLTPEIIRLTGITPEMVEGAPPLNEVLDAFLDFLPPGVPCVAHNASFERTFLGNTGRPRLRNACYIDTVGLARIAFPELESHSQGYLCEVLGIANPDAHRALADALALAEIWNRIRAALRRLPLALVAEMNQLLAPHNGHPYVEYFRALEEEIAAGATPLESDFLALYPESNLRAAAPGDDPATKEKWVRLDRRKVEWVFGADGPLAKTFERFEPRPGQVAMAGEVVEAFNRGGHLLVEAGTGTGKSLAYLIPAVLWARENGAPVVISTNTKNLQEQLYEKDAALVKKALGLDFNAALLKGRGNYLCLRKLFYLLRQGEFELDLDDRMQLLTLLSWSIRTKSGDISESILNGRPGFGRLWIKLCSTGEDCLGRKCKQYRRCFLRKARSAAMQAQIVIANHSLVFSEMGSANPALPPFQQLIFDEAHNLEDAATSHLSVEVSPSNLDMVIGRVFRYGRKRARTGLLPSLSDKLASNTLISAALREQALRHADEALAAAEKVAPAGEEFFARLDAIRTAHPDAPATLRFTKGTQRADLWEPALAAKTALAAAIGGVLAQLALLVEDVKQIAEEDVPAQVEFVHDLGAAESMLRQFGDDLEFAMAGDNEEYVYWLERLSGKPGDVKAVAAPINVGTLLHDRLYAQKRNIVFCSATMTVNHKFAFLKERLGIGLLEADSLREFDAGTPFDYPAQCRILTPSFLPEPGEKGRDYTKELSELLLEIIRSTAGRALGLFTSYEMLTRVFHYLSREMVRDGIKLLAQGQSGSRKNITSIFQHDIHSVLLGTHSFWEGVDVVGESLSCVIIARLPFGAVGDPLNEARCEYIEKHGGNAFMHYSLPTAVIRFRQGFGRLIRHRHDRGVVVVADRRIVAKRYGQHFQNSVPCKTEEIPDRDKFLRLLREFLPAPGGPGQEAAPGKQPGQGEPPAPARDQGRMQFEREKLD